MGEAAELEEGLAGRQRVGVEQHLFGRLGGTAFARHAADQRVLPARAVAAEIGVRSVGRRHRGVILLDASLHLGEELVL